MKKNTSWVEMVQVLNEQRKKEFSLKTKYSV